jgi:hypothetical protein
MLCILNERIEFKIGVFNNIYKINIGTYFKILNNVKLCTPLRVLILNFNHLAFISFKMK